MKWKFAFQLRKGKVFTVSAQSIKAQVHQTYAENLISHPGRDEKEQRTLARQAHISGGFFTGMGQQLDYHHDWVSKRSAHFALPPTQGEGSEAAAAPPVDMRAGSLRPDAHIHAIQLLQSAVAQNIPLQLLTWCPAAKHSTSVFGPTPPGMEAILEARMENAKGGPIVADLEIRERGTRVFVLEVYYTHKTRRGSRDGIPFAEIYAGEILDKLGTPRLPGQVVQLVCEPRTDAALTPCAHCHEAKREVEVEHAIQNCVFCEPAGWSIDFDGPCPNCAGLRRGTGDIWGNFSRDDEQQEDDDDDSDDDSSSEDDDSSKVTSKVDHLSSAGKKRTLNASASSAQKRACPARGEVREFSCPCPPEDDCRVNGCQRSHLHSPA